MSRPTLGAEPLLPSFSQSRTSTYDTEDGTHATEGSSLASGSFASDSMASTQSPGGGAYGKSARYKSAMTTRARQRRMRRMREREGDGGATPGSASVGTADSQRGGSVNGIPASKGSAPASPAQGMPTSAQVAHAKAHVEQMKASTGTRTTASPSPLQSRAYRSRSHSRSRESPGPGISTPGSSGIAANSPSHPEATGSHPPNDIPNVKAVTPQRSNAAHRTVARLDAGIPTPDFSPRPEEYFPDWQATGGGLSPDEVRDAANYTNIQFQMNHNGGEVEVFSDDGTVGDSVFSDEASGGRSHNLVQTGDHGGSDAANGAGKCWQNEVWSDATTPSLIQRGEIFHQKAAASIVSLLSPDRMLSNGLMAPEVRGSHEDEAEKDVEGDSPTGVVPGGRVGMFTFDGDGDPGSSRGGAWKGTKQVNRTLFREDMDEIDDDVRQSMIFRAFRQKMMDPSPQLSELLAQIHRKGGDIDRAYATRRKNACGALKILSAKEENRTKLCWTVGVLPAIASVLSDVDEHIPDELSRAANTEARNRVVSTLLNLSVGKKNRMLIVNTPGVLESIAETIQHDRGEGRQGCCTVLLYLAKTAEARTMIVKSGGMLEAMSGVIEVPNDQFNHVMTPPKTRGKAMPASSPVSPLCPGSPGESTLGSQSQCSGSDGSSRSKSSHSSEGSAVHPDEVEQMEIAFEANKREANNISVEVEKKPSEVQEDMYDADPNRYLHGARLSVFACLLCIVKSKDNAFKVAREPIVVETLVGVCQRHHSPSHARAIAILAHLTRHPKNCHQLVFKCPSLLPMLQGATASPDKEARRYAFCALQNLSMDKSCRAPIAHSPKIIWSLTQRCRERSNVEEDEARTAAVAALQNLADEPANLIQFTIVKDCIGTIARIAREDVVNGKRTDLTSFMAKNTLVTLSHWFRKIATSGSERMSRGSGSGRSQLYNARLDPTTFDQWT